MGLSRLRLAGHVLFFLLPGNGYVKVLEELAVEKTSGSNKSLAMTVVAKVAFSKEREAGDSWWVSDGAGCVPRKEEAFILTMDQAVAVAVEPEDLTTAICSKMRT